MNKVEIAKLLTLIAAVDNRNVDDVTVEMWFQIVGHCEYGEAARAVTRFFAESDAYLAPRGLLAQIKKDSQAYAEVEHHETLQVEVSRWKSDPEPICVPHNQKITKCDPCCFFLGEETEGMTNYQIAAWANQFIGFRETV
tara:strand:- start:2335 stop:2754 length:420 start_codon:yes stop_codon:yes gene_type:complete